MPLLDHFHAPLLHQRHWEGFHSRWASAIVDSLNDHWLPEPLIAEPHVHIGGLVEVDVATWKGEAGDGKANGKVAVQPKVWTAPSPPWVLPGFSPETFEIKIFSFDSGPNLVAAIELISPSNMDRPSSRRAFAVKCASYLCQGISLVIVDIVTSLTANMHNETMTLLEKDASFMLPKEATLYAVAYHPVRRDDKDEIDVWPHVFQVGDSLPTMPLSVAHDLIVPVELEATYLETCQKLRLR